MKITDTEVKNLLHKANSDYLFDSICNYPDEEIDGQTDMEIFINELEHLLSLYSEDNTLMNKELKRARNFLKETKNGKVIPCCGITPKYTLAGFESKHRESKETINEYNRLVRMAKKLGIR